MLILDVTNRETRDLTIKLVLIFAIIIILSTLILYREVNNLNREYIKENIGFIGAVLEKYPELEVEIVSNLSNGYIENYEYGKNILQKYSYDINLDFRKNRVINSFYYNFLFNILILLFVGFISFYITVLKDFNRVFKKIKRFSCFTEAVIEGNYDINIVVNKEGDLYIFAHQLNSMANLLKENIEKLKKEKLFLKETITNISHQLKTPIASLTMFNEILNNDDELDVKDRKKFIDMSLTQLERMEWLVKNLLKLAKLDAGVVDFKIEEKPIEDTISKAVDGIKVKAEGKNQRIIIGRSGTGLLKHDSEWTAEALSNIIKNSIEHTQEGGKIEIHWEETPLSLQIIIRDNGQGIPTNDLNKIFRRFYKGENSLNPSSIGIGLALTKEIIESQGGSISVESEEGNGAKFKISFLKSNF